MVDGHSAAAHALHGLRAACLQHGGKHRIQPQRSYACRAHMPLWLSSGPVRRAAQYTVNAEAPYLAQFVHRKARRGGHQKRAYASLLRDVYKRQSLHIPLYDFPKLFAGACSKIVIKS